MKKVVFIALLILFGCKKEEEKFCWTCWTDQIGTNFSKSTSEVLCDKTDSDIGEYIRANTKETTLYNQTVRCQLKE